MPTAQGLVSYEIRFYFGLNLIGWGAERLRIILVRTFRCLRPAPLQVGRLTALARMALQGAPQSPQPTSELVATTLLAGRLITISPDLPWWLYVSSFNQPGVWSTTPPGIETPLPPAFLLFSGALGLLILLGKLKRRNAKAQLAFAR
jgi:hypothetical protein